MLSRVWMRAQRIIAEAGAPRAALSMHHSRGYSFGIDRGSVGSRPHVGPR